MKLDHYKCKKVTKPDFPGKLSNFLYKQFFKKSVFGHFLENASLLLAEIAYLDSSQHYLQLFYWHHGRENSSSPIFLEKNWFLIKKIHYLPISRKILLLQGSNSPVMIIRWLSTTFLLTPCLGKADFLIWLPSIS